MKPFNIEITRIEKGPKDLEYQLPISATIVRQITGKDRPDYFLAELESPLVWVSGEEEGNKEVTHLIICTKYKEHDITPDMKKVLIAVAYVLDNSVITDAKLNFKKCKYIALGYASAKGKWRIFG